MKACRQCGSTENAFTAHPGTADKLQTVCNPCLGRYVNDRNLVIINEARNQPCADCGVQYPWYVMEFDHRGDKIKTIAAMKRAGIAKLLAEMAKCDVVCANCHKVRTHTRRS